MSISDIQKRNLWTKIFVDEIQWWREENSEVTVNTNQQISDSDLEVG